MTHHRGNMNVVWVWFGLFGFGKCTHLGTLNSICHLLDHVCSWIKSDWRMLLSVSDLILRQMMLSSAKSRIGDWMLLFMSFMYSRKRTDPRTEPCGTPDVTHVLSDRVPLRA